VRVKEILAGRVSIQELWPLTLPEMATTSWDDPVEDSRLVTWLKGDPRTDEILFGCPATSRSFARATSHFDRYLHFGGMPVVHDPDLSEEDRQEWLKNYQRTYLERDVADLAALRDLGPFVVAQKALAARSGRLVNFSDLAKTASISPATARRFLRYLEVSCQVLTSYSYQKNPEKRLSKMPKIHFLDPGVLRSVVGRRGPLTGEEFESAVVAEIYKQVKTASLPVDFFHLRTYDGREVDLLLELEEGYVACEIKLTESARPTDARPLRGLGELLHKPLLKSLVISQDRDVRLLEKDVVAVPAAWLLSPPGDD